MINLISVEISELIYNILQKFWIRKKFDKQIHKLQNWNFDNWLNFEKIKTSKNIYFYSFRIDIHYHAYLRKESWIFIIFDVNNHDYEKIKNKLKNS